MKHLTQITSFEFVYKNCAKIQTVLNKNVTDLVQQSVYLDLIRQQFPKVSVVESVS